jgi:hypothetical protein
MLPVTSETCPACTWRVNSQIASYRGIGTQEYSFVDFFYRLGSETSLVNLACIIKLSWLRSAFTARRELFFRLSIQLSLLPQRSH